jgi:hypothetical protein
MATNSKGKDRDEDSDTASSWIVSTDEINSQDSDSLYERRPNRWRGPKSTWRTYTKEERATADSLTRVRDRDLGVHLYNAFAIKRDAETAGAESVSGNEVVRFFSLPLIMKSV